MSKLAPETITITPATQTLVDFEFDADLDSGESITAVTSVASSPSGVNIVSTSKSTTRAQALINCTTVGSYTLQCKITASNSQTFEGAGRLVVAALG